MAATLRSEGPVADRPGAGVDRHKLDGSDASAFARGTGVTVLANRIVLGDGQVDVLLTHPDLGNLSASCMGAGSPLASIFWTNTGATVMDTWYNTTADARYRGVWSSPNSGRQVARYNASDQLLYGDTLIVGKGTTPAARSTATVTLAAFRSEAGAPCSFQASATLWSAP